MVVADSARDASWVRMHVYRAYCECRIYDHECTRTWEYNTSSNQYFNRICYICLVDKVNSTVQGEALSLYTWEPGKPWKFMEAHDCKYQWWRVKARGWVYDYESVACESIWRSQHRWLPDRSYSNRIQYGNPSDNLWSQIKYRYMDRQVILHDPGDINVTPKA